jgi:hypothetical protein
MSSYAVIYVLLENGALVDIPIMQGYTPLYHEAIQSYDIAWILLNSRARID